MRVILFVAAQRALAGIAAQALREDGTVDYNAQFPEVLKRLFKESESQLGFGASVKTLENEPRIQKLMLAAATRLKKLGHQVLNSDCDPFPGI